jgi:hypothetical protein
MALLPGLSHNVTRYGEMNGAVHWTVVVVVSRGFQDLSFFNVEDQRYLCSCQYPSWVSECADRLLL